MRDWNLRVILTRIWGARQLDMKSWAVQLRPGSEAQAVIEEQLWRDRGEVTPLYSPAQGLHRSAPRGAVFPKAEVAA